MAHDLAGSCPRLPIEVWDGIIAFYGNDHQTLAVCSLVCRAWSPTCRMHRFREVKVKPRAVGRPLAASLLCDPTSTVLPYVRSLVMVEGLLKKDLNRSDRDAITLHPAVGSKAYWLDDILPTMRICELTALESLSLQALQWESLSSSSRGSIVELCRPLRCLEVTTWDPLDIPCTAVNQFLSAAASLEHFALHLPKQNLIPPIDPDELPLPSGTNATLALQSLEINNAVGCYLKAIPRQFSTLHITEVSLRGLGRNDVEALISFLTLCTPSLQQLSLQMHDPYAIWGEVEDVLVKQGGLSCATSLRSLTLDARLTYIPSIVRQLASPHLTDLNVRIPLASHSNRYALNQGKEKHKLAQSLTTGPLATIRPRVSILLLPTSGMLPHHEVAELGRARDVILADLVSLRDEGRLRIMRCVKHPRTHREVMNEL